MNQPYYVKDGKKRQVKNLGWLIAKMGQTLISKVICTKCRPDVDYGEGELYVLFEDGIEYFCHFESYAIMVRWIHNRRNSPDEKYIEYK